MVSRASKRRFTSCRSTDLPRPNAANKQLVAAVPLSVDSAKPGPSESSIPYSPYRLFRQPHVGDECVAHCGLWCRYWFSWRAHLHHRRSVTPSRRYRRSPPARVGRKPIPHRRRPAVAATRARSRDPSAARTTPRIHRPVTVGRGPPRWRTRTRIRPRTDRTTGTRPPPHNRPHRHRSLVLPRQAKASPPPLARPHLRYRLAHPQGSRHRHQLRWHTQRQRPRTRRHHRRRPVRPSHPPP